jgi:superfamily II DNA/RNA helicase
VFNFDAPWHPDDYVHRIGRTGRVGATGVAYTLVTPDDAENIANIEKLTGQKIPVLDLNDTPADAAPEPEAAPVEEAPRRARRRPAAEGDAPAGSIDVGVNVAEGAQELRIEQVVLELERHGVVLEGRRHSIRGSATNHGVSVEVRSGTGGIEGIVHGEGQAGVPCGGAAPIMSRPRRRA